MADKKQKVVYWGAAPLDIGEYLSAHVDFKTVDQDVTIIEVLSGSYRDAVFLLGVGATVWNQPEMFAKLPANLILYDLRCILSPEIQRMADLKNAHPLDFTDRDRLVHVVHYDFFPGRWSYKLPFESLRVASTFQGDVLEEGQVGITLRGNFGADWTTIATWQQMTWSYGDWYETLYPECQFSKDVDVQFLVRVVSIKSGALLSTHHLDASHFQDGITFYVGKEDAYIMVSVTARGEGDVTLGWQHVNRTRETYGHLFAGGEMIKEPQALSQGVATYFEAGDLKPPLIVYFSGFHGAETFEGNYMMRIFKSPYLLVTDNRLEGGASYFGSDGLEEQIAAAIRNTLKRLGFGPHDIIFTGLSMGTTAALYYGAQLLPRAIVVGKPLPDWGTVALTGRLLRPTGFPTALDMLLIHQGNTDSTAVAGLNEHFWKKFRKADFSRTILGIAYMKQDDYQPDAFPKIYRQLSEQNGRVQLLHKGWIGRHNDDTNSVVAWFVRTIRLTLKNEFNRPEAMN
ncbi:accessory Sec system protein Asp2 [Schleiferilactobacillus perolens]|uniref:Accessory secretory protein Asp2 n=1 Tax=Schleiferilactobacillus perolens DSM 12744 TaxID=1423792 RepID=A0A0R1MJT1_9LACO|nr:accessory Sec system protein Asp2 [Schleiferilactobacillus perolens]KRL08208.1 accessory secretory protein Asp2 [Schleiferilactobacillus perolens DSM 12744]